MPDIENWEKYGFPDDIFFRSPYLPGVGLVKALNERLEAVNAETIEVPQYFHPYPGMVFTTNFQGKLLNDAASRFVNPDKISTAERYEDCFWDAMELQQIGLDGEDWNNVTSPSRPEFSAKWAIWMYKQINILRYVATSSRQEWPDVFTYEDRYSSFNFKAPEP